MFHFDKVAAVVFPVAVLLAVLFATGCDSEPTVETDPDPFMAQRAYFPLIPGSEWVYRQGQRTLKYIVVDRFHREIGDSALIRVERSGEATFMTAAWRHDHLYIATEEALETPGLYLSLPLRKGKKWTVFDYEMDETQAEVIAEDSLISVSAGTYYAMVVRHIYSYGLPNSDSVRTDTSWLAYTLNVGRLFFDAGGHKEELLRFTIGDEDG